MKLKSIGAVVAGVGANLLAIPVDGVLFAAGVFSTDPNVNVGEVPYAIALAYRTGFAVLGGWITARLAPSSPLKHAWVLGGLGVVFPSLGAVAQWQLGHHWYQLSLLAIAIPATLLGAHLLLRGRS